MSESVRGTVIGPITFPYRFLTLPDEDGHQTEVARRLFENDEEAINWIKAHKPDAFAKGLEMRCYDQEETR